MTKKEKYLLKIFHSLGSIIYQTIITGLITGLILGFAMYVVSFSLIGNTGEESFRIFKIGFRIFFLLGSFAGFIMGTVKVVRTNILWGIIVGSGIGFIFSAFIYIQFGDSLLPEESSIYHRIILLIIGPIFGGMAGGGWSYELRKFKDNLR